MNPGLSNSDDPLLGRVLLGRYRVVQRMARGGMGVVYLGRAEGAEGFVKPVVLKSVLPELEGDDATQRMFIREARILSRLSHPNIVSILDFGVDGDAYVMALEYVRGYDLRRWSKWVWRTRAPMPTDLCAHIVIKVLDALEYAHNLRDAAGNRTQVVHRDITPSNVLLSDDGQVMLVDFGIAKDVSGDADLRTEAGSIKGKFPYLAPELFGGEAPTPLSDIYACGAVLREILVGKNVLNARDPAATIQRVLYEPIGSIVEERPDIPPALVEVVERAMAREPSARFASAEEMRNALSRAVSRDESELRQQLREQVRADFYGPMPSRMKLTPLDELRVAWEETPLPRLPAISEPPTRPARPAPQESVTSPRSARTSLPWIIAGIGAVASLIAAVTMAVLAFSSSPPPPVVIHHEARAPDALAEPEEAEVAQTGAPPGAQPDAPGAVAEEEEDEEDGEGGAREATRPTRASPGQRLRRAVARRRDAFEACFRRHAAALQGEPEVTLRFSVSADGAVQSVDVLPAALATTPVGSCLGGVARATRFEPPGRALTFRVPLRARVH